MKREMAIQYWCFVVVCVVAIVCMITEHFGLASGAPAFSEMSSKQERESFGKLGLYMGMVIGAALSMWFASKIRGAK